MLLYFIPGNFWLVFNIITYHHSRYRYNLSWGKRCLINMHCLHMHLRVTGIDIIITRPSKNQTNHSQADFLPSTPPFPLSFSSLYNFLQLLHFRFPWTLFLTCSIWRSTTRKAHVPRWLAKRERLGPVQRIQARLTRQLSVSWWMEMTLEMAIFDCNC